MPMAVLLPPYQLDAMDEIEENIGIEIEAPTTFSGAAALADEDNVLEEDAEQLNDDDESMNDESVTTSYTAAGYSYITSNIKWFVIAMASFAVFLGIGIGSGYGIDQKIYGNDNDASVSAAMATVDFTTSENGGAKSGKGEGGGGAKSGKSSGSKSGKTLKESEKCVYKPSKEKNAGCKAWPFQYDKYMMGRWASGTLSSYSIPSIDECPVEIDLMPGGPPNLRRLDPISPRTCYDIDFRSFEIKESDVVNTDCGDPHSVVFTAPSYDEPANPTMLPLLFSNIYGENCAELKIEAPNMGTAGLVRMGVNTWGYTMWLKPGWHAIVMVAVVPQIEPSIPEWAIVGECGINEQEYTFSMDKGELQAPEMVVEESSNVSLWDLIDGILSTYDIIPEDGSSQAVANSNDK